MSCTFLNDERQTHFLRFSSSTSRFCALKFRIFSISLFMFKRSKIASQKITNFLHPRRSMPRFVHKNKNSVLQTKFEFKFGAWSQRMLCKHPNKANVAQLPTVSLTKLATAPTQLSHLFCHQKANTKPQNCPFCPDFGKTESGIAGLSDTECQKLLRLHSKTFINFFLCFISIYSLTRISAFFGFAHESSVQTVRKRQKISDTSELSDVQNCHEVLQSKKGDGKSWQISNFVSYLWRKFLWLLFDSKKFGNL